MTNEEAVAILAEALNDVEAIDYGSAKLTQMIQRKEAIKQAIFALHKQPRWIPCGERLPEELGDYLISIKRFGWNCEEYVENDIAYWDDIEGFHKEDKVIAWMPLPEPYRGGE